MNQWIAYSAHFCELQSSQPSSHNSLSFRVTEDERIMKINLKKTKLCVFFGAVTCQKGSRTKRAFSSFCIESE